MQIKNTHLHHSISWCLSAAYCAKSWRGSGEKDTLVLVLDGVGAAKQTRKYPVVISSKKEGVNRKQGFTPLLEGDVCVKIQKM